MTVRIVGVNIVAGAPEYITTRGLVPTNFWQIITIQNRSRLSPPDRLVPTNMFDIPAPLHTFIQTHQHQNDSQFSVLEQFCVHNVFLQ